MYDRLAAALLGLTGGGGRLNTVLDTIRATPAKRSAKSSFAANKINEGFAKHSKDVLGRDLNVAVAQVDPLASPEQLALAKARPESFNTAFLPGDMPGLEQPLAVYTPNADRIYAAKALGAAVHNETAVGQALHKAQKYLNDSPNLQKALQYSQFLLPGATAALIEGDNDSALSAALAIAPASLTLAKELGSTVHGQRIMDKSGLRTTLGQRGRLAGSLLQHVAAPLLIGTTGNMVGNIFD